MTGIQVVFLPVLGNDWYTSSSISNLNYLITWVSRVSDAYYNFHVLIRSCSKSYNLWDYLFNLIKKYIIDE